MLREQRAEGRESGRAEGEAPGEAHGEARGSRIAFAAASLQLLVQRLVMVPEAARSRIESADAQRLQGWFAKAPKAKSIDEALADGRSSALGPIDAADAGLPTPRAQLRALLAGDPSRLRIAP